MPRGLKEAVGRQPGCVEKKPGCWWKGNQQATRIFRLLVQKQPGGGETFRMLAGGVATTGGEVLGGIASRMLVGVLLLRLFICSFWASALLLVHSVGYDIAYAEV